jgi:predicted phosphate transport protein (TIGR00153 family)
VRIIPRDEGFFALFDALARRIRESSALMRELISDPARMDDMVAQIKRVEHEADMITHDVRARIDKSFVTPFDREDILMLTSALDDVVDLIDGASRRVVMFHISESRPAARRLAETLERAAEHIVEAVASIRSAKIVTQRSREIKRLEEEGDAIYQEAVGELFRDATDAMLVLKWKDIYDVLEQALDRCYGVGNVLESIAVKHS